GVDNSDVCFGAVCGLVAVVRCNVSVPDSFSSACQRALKRQREDTVLRPRSRQVCQEGMLSGQGLGCRVSGPVVLPLAYQSTLVVQVAVGGSERQAQLQPTLVLESNDVVGGGLQLSCVDRLEVAPDVVVGALGIGATIGLTKQDECHRSVEGFTGQ